MVILICCFLIISNVEHPSIFFLFLGGQGKDGDKNHSVLMLIPVIGLLRLALF